MLYSWSLVLGNKARICQSNLWLVAERTTVALLLPVGVTLRFSYFYVTMNQPVRVNVAFNSTPAIY